MIPNIITGITEYCNGEYTVNDSGTYTLTCSGGNGGKYGIVHIFINGNDIGGGTLPYNYSSNFTYDFTMNTGDTFSIMVSHPDISGYMYMPIDLTITKK